MKKVVNKKPSFNKLLVLYKLDFLIEQKSKFLIEEIRQKIPFFAKLKYNFIFSIGILISIIIIKSV